MLALYDPLTRVLGLRSAHAALADAAGLRDGQRVLEIGCGTGNLALLVKRRHGGSDVVGLDPDPQALARAERKARRRRLALRLDRGYAEQLPYDDGSFDRVLSAFMFHHLQSEGRQAALREAARVLRPGGSIHLLDFGGAREASVAWGASPAGVRREPITSARPRAPTSRRRASRCGRPATARPPG
jgi:ubiquinone/menaquinone biosynthesis C-methylase UbiE